MTDRTGMTYEELLKIQEQHLTIWSGRIEPTLFVDVQGYARSMNQEAKDATQKHRVFRGQDLIELFRTWPDINTAVYPPRADSAEAMI
jgi:hypothetical protein